MSSSSEWRRVITVCGTSRPLQIDHMRLGDLPRGTIISARYRKQTSRHTLLVFDFLLLDAGIVASIVQLGESRYASDVLSEVQGNAKQAGLPKRRFQIKA